MKKEEHESQKKAAARYLRYSHAGLQFFLAVGLLTFGGIWLDGYLGTRVLFTLLGLAVGFGVGLRSLYLEVYGRKRGGDDNDRDRSPHGDAGPPERSEKARPEDQGPRR